MFEVANGQRKILFVINRHAGIGYQGELEKKIHETCEKHHAACSIEFTQHRGHGIELARDASSNGFNQVVAVGGDGTSNEVAQGLIHTDVSMGIIPRGSGNGLARHLGIPLKPFDAITSLFESTSLPIDAFTLNGKLSLNVSGIGFDGHVTNLFGIKSTRGLFGYVTLTIQEFLKFREFEITIREGGKSTIHNAFIIAIANSSQYGNNARIAPAASVRDGLLHINIVKKVPFYRLDFVYSFFNGDIQKSSFCDILETASVELKTKTPVAYHVDGEACGLTDTFVIELLPGALNMLVPDKAHSHGI